MAFRILDQAPQYFTLDGEILAGGSLTFTQSGTSFPLDTYSDQALTIPNANPVILDASGRSTTDIWGNGNYRIVVADSIGNVLYTRDNVQVPGASATAIPGLVTGYYLTNDGTNLVWGQVRQVPDPTGQANKVLGTDGANVLWIAKPTNGGVGTNGTDAAVSATAAKILAGDGTTGHDQAMFQMGSGNAPASGGHGTSTTITFPTAFKALAGVWVTITSASFASSGYLASVAITTKSMTGFAVSFDTNSSDGSNGNIIGAIPFDWIAVGTLAQ